MDDKDVKRLCDAIIARAAEDYINLLVRYYRIVDTEGKEIGRKQLERQIKNLEDWFHSDWAYALAPEWEAEAVIELAKGKAWKRYQKIRKGEDKRATESKQKKNRTV